MEVNSTSRPKTDWTDWPHPSLCGEVLLTRSRRVQSNRYPDFGIEPHSAFPICIGGIGNCSRYSGATVPDLHRVPRHL